MLVSVATGFLFPCCLGVSQTGCRAIGDKFPEFPVPADMKTLYEHRAQMVVCCRFFGCVFQHIIRNLAGVRLCLRCEEHTYRDQLLLFVDEKCLMAAVMRNIACSCMVVV